MGALSQMRFEDFVEAVAAKTPTPGGGSVSAAVSAYGAALGIMAARFSKGDALAESSARLEEIKGELTQLVDKDAEAYELVHQARGLPKDTDDEKGRRKDAIQNALAEAAQVPLRGMQLAVEALEALRTMTPDVSPYLVSDLGTAATLLEAGMKGCEMNVLINVQSIKSRKLSGALKKESADLARRGKAAAGQVMRHVRKAFEKK
jgi:formiminotetrahydrofolate cyclodeaminase